MTIVIENSHRLMKELMFEPGLRH